MKPAFVWLVLGLAAGLLLTACAVAASPASEPEPTLAPSDTPIPTSTIIWFPATDTPLPVVTPSPLPVQDLRSGVAELSFTDSFNGSGWQLLRDQAGSVAFGQNELTLAVRQPKKLVSTLHNELVLGDFYMEITISPSLCRGADAYGLLMRAASPQDTYRLLFSCAGQIRLERLMDSRVTILQDWVYSGQVPPGSPVVLRVGVWLLGREMRVFVNDIYQFSAADAVWRSGGLGLFARSAGDTALTVNYTDLKVYALDPARVLPTRTPTATPLPTATLTRIAPNPTYLPR